MRDLLNNNGKLVTLMGSLFAGIIAVTGAAKARLPPRSRRGRGRIPPRLRRRTRITPALSTPRLIPMGRSR